MGGGGAENLASQMNDASFVILLHCLYGDMFGWASQGFKEFAYNLQLVLLTPRAFLRSNIKGNSGLCLDLSLIVDGFVFLRGGC